MSIGTIPPPRRPRPKVGDLGIMVFSAPMRLVGSDSTIGIMHGTVVMVLDKFVTDWIPQTRILTPFGIGDVKRATVGCLPADERL